MEQQAECKCDPGFMDIRKSEKRTMVGLSEDVLCMHVRDVDECALGLTNCSGVAQCIDRAIGYTCKCPDGYIDGNPDEPGRVCGALLCDMCKPLSAFVNMSNFQVTPTATACITRRRETSPVFAVTAGLENFARWLHRTQV